MTISSNHKSSLLLLPIVAALGIPVSVVAQTSFKVQDIQVDGLRRIDPGTVFSYLPIRVGDTFDEDKAQNAIRALYETGFFEDVQVAVKGDVLVVTVIERPAIATVEFEGIKEFDPETLKNALKQVGISESQVFDKSLLEKAEQELKRQYLSRSKYGAQVQTVVNQLPRNRVSITFKVDEGKSAAISQLKIIGNSDFSSEELLDLFSLSESGWMSWLSKNDQYSRQKLSGDLEKLRSFYLNQGYADFNIENTQVQIAPNKQDVFITILIKEGQKFKFGQVNLTGDLLGRESELNALIEIKQGDVFSGEKLTQTSQNIEKKLGNYGYAFANVNVMPNIDRATQIIDLNIAIDPGKRVYVRRININGNDRTRDEVIRREFRQFESSFYDAEKIQLSRSRVDRLGFFKEVAVDTKPVPGSSDQVDIDLNVEEKPTGNLLLGAGVSSTDSVVLSAAIQQQNLFGTGKTVGLELNTSKVNRTLSFSQTDPFYTLDGVSRTINFFDRITDAQELSLGDYKLQTTGAGISFGYPISEFERINFGASFEATKLEVDDSSPRRFINYVSAFGTESDAYLVNASYVYDSRDSAIAPTDGNLRRLSAEVATPLGEQEFYRLTYQEQVFIPILDHYTLALNGEATLGAKLGNSSYPIFRNSYAGGIGTVRGFRTSSLGPRDSDDVPTGAPRRLIGNVEFFFPVPGVKKDRTFRAFTFLDAGNVFESNETVRLSSLRYSAGFGISWLSPVGPLKFSYGIPINRKDEDDLQKIQFTIGTGF